MPPSSLPLLPLLLILALPSAHPLPTDNAIQKVFSWPLSRSLFLSHKIAVVTSVQCSVLLCQFLYCHVTIDGKYHDLTFWLCQHLSFVLVLVNILEKMSFIEEGGKETEGSDDDCLQEVGQELPAVLKRCQPLTLARLPARWLFRIFRGKSIKNVTLAWICQEFSLSELYSMFMGSRIYRWKAQVARVVLKSATLSWHFHCALNILVRCTHIWRRWVQHLIWEKQMLWCKTCALPRI